MNVNAMESQDETTTKAINPDEVKTRPLLSTNVQYTAAVMAAVMLSCVLVLTSCLDRNTEKVKAIGVVAS